MADPRHGETGGREESQQPSLTDSKGILKSLSEGIRSLLVLNEKLGSLGREGGETRREVLKIQELLYRLIGREEVLEKRLSERFAEIDKRLMEIDKRIDLKIELAVRTEFDRRLEMK